MRPLRLSALLAAAALLLLVLAPQVPAPPGPGRAGGAFTCDFGVRADVPLERVPPTIERDRMYMAERPGMLFKHVPLRPDPANQQLLSGGRYLFDTAADAAEYHRWVRDDFDLDGVLFLERPEFVAPDCHAWEVVGTRAWGSLEEDQDVLRTERWEAPGPGVRAALEQRWPALAAAARDRGFTAVWLLHQPQVGLVNLVYFDAGALPLGPVPDVTDPAGLLLLEAQPPLGAAFDGLGWTKVMDRTQFSLTIWHPFRLGDHGKPSVWPNAPVLPEPGPGDGVCEVSRGEDHTNAPECLPTCGNRRADHREDTWNCPGDVRIAWD